MNEGERQARVVDGRFELEVRLGGGGMGTVWRARDLVLHRSVAIKEVRPPDIDLAEFDPDGARMLRERVLREARALARVEHPNVVTIHHIVDGGQGTYPWIVMEFVDGGSLADRLGKGPMAPVVAARLGRDVLAALRAAHAVGVQHRDVKPANVLLRRDGRPVLTDFGIAAIRESTTLTASGAIIGTPDYMAPERVSGKPGGPEADLWSLAMMLYVAVEGNHPLRRDTTLATLAAVLYDDVPPPAQAGPLTAVLTRLLVRDPAARPDAETVDRMLAAAAQADTAPETTSYPLAPPIPAAGPGFVTDRPTAVPGSPAAGEGQPTWEPRDAVPFLPPVGPTGVGAPGARPSAGRARRTRSLVVACAALGTILVGGLVWQLLPDGEAKDTAASAGTTGAARHNTSAPTAATSDPAGRETSEKTTNLLTPDGIRSAIKAIEKSTGRDMFGSFVVYPEYVVARVMVEGSRTRFDSYTYYVDRGVEKGFTKGTLMGGDRPVSLKNFDWDAVPALLTEAKKQLKVDKPTSRYLMVDLPDTTFDTPAGMLVYLSNAYKESGYLQADTKGKVTRVMPNDK